MFYISKLLILRPFYIVSTFLILSIFHIFHLPASKPKKKKPSFITNNVIGLPKKQ